jgi:hypothetical protein
MKILKILACLGPMVMLVHMLLQYHNPAMIQYTQTEENTRHMNKETIHY